MFIALLDSASRPSESVKILNFKTLPTYLPAKFSVYVTQVSSIQQIITGTAKALSLPTSCLLSIGTDPALGLSRRLDTITDPSQKLFYELVLFINKSLESEKPITYVKNLDYNPEKLIAYIPYFDSSTTISSSATEYSALQASFNSGFEVYSDSSGTVFVHISISTNGNIYAVILGTDKACPSSIQIRNGLDAHNIKVRSGRYSFASVSQDQMVLLNFTGLPLHQFFIVYLTAENDLPGNPELLSDEYILAVEVVVSYELDTSFNFTFQYLNSAFKFVPAFCVVLIS